MSEKRKAFEIQLSKEDIQQLLQPVETPLGSFPVEQELSRINFYDRGRLGVEPRVITRYVLPVHDEQYLIVTRNRPGTSTFEWKKPPKQKKRRVEQAEPEPEPEKVESPFGALADTVIAESTYLQKLSPRVQTHVHNALVDFVSVGVDAVGQRWNSLSTDEQLRLTSRVVREDSQTSLDQIDAVSILLMANGLSEGRALQQTLVAFRQLFQLIQTNSSTVQEYRNMVARNRGKHLNPAEQGREFHTRPGGGVPSRRKTGLGPILPKKKPKE